MAQTLKQQDLQTYVPPTKKPNVRTDRSRGNAFDSYGLRPLCHPWKLLSAYEFLRQWQVVPLLVPTHYLNRKETPRTQWTEEGKAFVKTKEYRAGKVAAKAGVHFIAVINDKDGYYLYPEEPKSVFAVFRHSWALVRRNRPHVVIIEALRMPSTNRTPTYNSQYCSLFFRPWTLLQGDSLGPQVQEEDHRSLREGGAQAGLLRLRASMGEVQGDGVGVHPEHRCGAVSAGRGLCRREGQQDPGKGCS